MSSSKRAAVVCLQLDEKDVETLYEITEYMNEKSGRTGQEVLNTAALALYRLGVTQFLFARSMDRSKT